MLLEPVSYMYAVAASRMIATQHALPRLGPWALHQAKRF